MKLVIIESPFGKRVDGSPCTPQEMADNLVYARACMRDCLRMGWAPYGSHLLYPQVLDDATPEERKLGMEAGFAFAHVIAAAHRANLLVHPPFVGLYTDRGITPGMLAGVEKHRANGLEIVERRLGGGWAK
jgi:hypothetical protein